MIGKLLAPALNRRLAERLRKAEADLAARDAHIADLEQQISNPNTCVSIRRAGRITHWTFIANGAIVHIETMGMLEDDVSGWCATLGIEQS